MRIDGAGVKMRPLMKRAGQLTDTEGAFVALVRRNEPVSAYQIAKHYELCPIYTLNTAKGKIYPLLHRLLERGLLSSTQVENDRRHTQLYSCTAAGRSALKSWVKCFRAEHELPPDPLRRKMQAIDLLEPAEQLAWVEEARSRLIRKMQAVKAYEADVEGPFGRFAQDNARETLNGRLNWLDRLECSIRSGTGAVTESD